jgi:D-sedoheptulose 7-phosphate isomerase
MVVAFSTSGRSENVVRGLAAARAQGATTVLFGGGEGRPASDHADHAFLLTSTDTARIQEMHVLLLHLIIDQVDEWAAAAS